MKPTHNCGKKNVAKNPKEKGRKLKEKGEVSVKNRNSNRNRKEGEREKDSKGVGSILNLNCPHGTDTGEPYAEKR